MVDVQLPTSLNETAADIAASFAALEVEEGSVEVEVTQTWSHTLSSSAATTKAMLVAKVLETCEAVSPGCRVSLVSLAEGRALATSGGTGTGGYHHNARKLSIQADVRVVRIISGMTLSTAPLQLPMNVTATASLLVTVDARMTVVVQSSNRTEAQALSSSLTAERVAAQLSTLLVISPTQLVVAVSDPKFPPLPPPPPPVSPPQPPSPTPPLSESEGARITADVASSKQIIRVAGSIAGSIVCLLLVFLLRRRRQKFRKVSPEAESRKEPHKRKSYRVSSDESLVGPSGAERVRATLNEQRVELGAAMHRAASGSVESSSKRALPPLEASALPSSELPATRLALPPIGAANSSRPLVTEGVEEEDVGQHWAFGFGEKQLASAENVERDGIDDVCQYSAVREEAARSLSAARLAPAANRVLSKEALGAQTVQERQTRFRQSRIVLEGTQARPAPSLGGDPVPVRPAPSIGSGLLPVRPAPRLKSGRRQRRLSASKVLELTGGGGSTAHQPGFRAARVAPVQPGAERAALEMFAPTRRAPLPSAWRTQTWEPLPTTWRPAPAPPSPVPPLPSWRTPPSIRIPPRLSKNDVT